MQFAHIASLAALIVGIQAVAVPEVFRRSSGVCSTGDFQCGEPHNAMGSPCNVQDVQNIADYLVAAGDDVITVTSGSMKAVGATGGCYVYGYAVGESCTTSSYAKDVGAGLKDWQYDCCGNPDTCQGFNTASGNGNFQLEITTKQLVS